MAAQGCFRPLVVASAVAADCSRGCPDVRGLELPDDLACEMTATLPAPYLPCDGISECETSMCGPKRSVKIQCAMKGRQRARKIQVGASFINKPPTPTLRSVGVQCSLLETEQTMSTKPLEGACTPDAAMGSDEDSTCSDDDTDDTDLDYDPMDEDYVSSDDEEDEDGEAEASRQSFDLRRDVRPDEEKQFLVSESALAELLAKCTVCGCQSNTVVEYTRGLLVATKTVCVHGHVREWQSQPCHKGLPWCNLLVAGAIIYSGSNAAKSLRLMKHMRLQTFSQSTYTRLQAWYTVPSCVSAWEDQQSATIQSLRQDDKSLTLGGDGRCDSPGYSAKFGCYTLMDLETNKILDFQLVQSNEVKGSCHMELEGLKRSLAFLESRELDVKDLVTNRHSMVKKYMRTTHPDKHHFFDVWHVAKGISKKLEAAAKQKECDSLRPWIKSIVNHCYWTAASCGRNAELKLDRWKTISQHVTNRHSATENYARCEHGDIEGTRMWLKTGSRAHKLLVDVIEMKSLLTDIPKLSPLHQTYGIEVYHSVVNNFAPKNTHFYYSALTGRICVAAMHFNENGKRDHAVTKDGTQRWQVAYPKGKKGDSVVVKPVRTPVTYDYVDTLRRVLVERRHQFDTYKKAAADAENRLRPHPPPLTASYQQIPKETLVSQRRSRYR